MQQACSIIQFSASIKLFIYNLEENFKLYLIQETKVLKFAFTLQRCSCCYTFVHGEAGMDFVGIYTQNGLENAGKGLFILRKINTAG